jgi:hypothetical protein
MQIITVTDRKTWRLFHRVLHEVYRDIPPYIFPLEKEVENVFDPSKNKAFEGGEAQCYVLLDERGRPAGRIAAFIDYARNEGQAHKIGGIGYFECVYQEDYADALFQTAEAYLKSKGAVLIDGPINFGERDKFWGLLVKGHEHSPLYQENYHPPYYEALFLQHNYRPFEQILTYKGDSRQIPFERMRALAERVRTRHKGIVKPLNFKEIEQFAVDFSIVYNAAFGGFEHFKPIRAAQVKTILEEAKAIADPQLACIAYIEDQPAGLIALYPDVNPFLKHAKGRLRPWSTLVFLFKNRFARTKPAKGMGFGIHPNFQSKGVFALLVDYLCSPRNLQLYPYMYLAAIRTHNHAARSIYAKLNVHVDRVHVAYRKYLDPTIPYEPFEFIKV